MICGAPIDEWQSLISLIGILLCTGMSVIGLALAFLNVWSKRSGRADS